MIRNNGKELGWYIWSLKDGRDMGFTFPRIWDAMERKRSSANEVFDDHRWSTSENSIRQKISFKYRFH